MFIRLRWCYSVIDNEPACLISGSRDLNTTYALNMELMPGGLLKQTTFDVNLQTSAVELMPLISVNIFAAGLAGIAGGDTATNEVG